MFRGNKGAGKAGGREAKPQLTIDTKFPSHISRALAAQCFLAIERVFDVVSSPKNQEIAQYCCPLTSTTLSTCVESALATFIGRGGRAAGAARL